MRKILALILASTFLTAAPAVVAQPVQAASLFERLFPRAAERRRERRFRRQQFRQQELDSLFEQRRRAEQRERRRRRAVTVKSTVKGPSLKVYVPRKVSTIKLATLSKSFSAYDQKLMAAFALKQERQKLQNGADDVDTLDEASTGGVTGSVQSVSQQQDVVAPVQEALKPETALPAVRLSAGADLLNSIALKTSKSLGKGLVAYYKKNPTFIWLDEDGKPNERAALAMQELARAADYGLNVEDYSMPLLTVGDDATEQDLLRAAIQFEFATTVAVLQYMMDAKHGVVDPNRISGYHDFKGLNLDFRKQLEKIASDERPDQLMVASHPQDKSFEALKNELSELQKTAEGFDSISIKPGTFLKPGQTNDQLENIVESIRRKVSKDFRDQYFDVFAVDHSAGDYTGDVVDMVRDFQKSAKLKPDGIVGRNTIARMIGDDPKVRMNKVLYAMERLRWHPDQLGNTHVFINQPAYRATYMKNGRPELSMRTVVGKKSNQTYFFHDKIEYVEFNPYWGIPRSILVNEMLPKLRNNPSYLDNLGYEITNVRGKTVYSSEVDWWGVGANFPYNVRQPPGRKNALGELKIMFPNKHSIYMHDTPSKSLFNRRDRAFSHGCVRLAEPRKMAAAVLGSSMTNIESRLLGGDNNRQRLAQQIPVYVSYFTAWPDENGKVAFFKDVYGRDAALAKAMAMETQTRKTARGA